MTYTTSAPQASGAPFHTVLERQVEDIRCSIVNLDSQAPRSAILHDRLSFWVPLNGRTQIYDRRARSYDYHGGGSISITPGGSVWEGHWKGEPQTCVLLEIGDSVLREQARHITYPNRGQMILREDERIRYSMLALYQDLKSPSPASGMFTGHLARGIAMHYIGQYCSTTAVKSAATRSLSAAELRRVYDLVDQRLTSKLTLADLADAVALSVPTFCRRFKSSTGLSPYQYVLQAKIDRAKALLRRSEVALTDLALSLGFYDQSQFTNTFRKIAGICPSEFRRRGRS